MISAVEQVTPDGSVAILTFCDDFCRHGYLRNFPEAKPIELSASVAEDCAYCHAALVPALSGA